MKTFLVISDIHSACHAPGAHDAPSYVTNRLPADAADDPFSRVVEALPKGVKVDAIFCPGDITDKAEPDALIYAWSALQRLADRLGAELIATVGNHDLDSRYKYDSDFRGLVMSLSPTLPVSDRQGYLEYWAEHFTILKRGDCCILVLNTAAHHGGGPGANDNKPGAPEKPYSREIEWGRVSDHTLQRIKKALQQQQGCKYGIVLCHHHLIRNNEIQEVDYSDSIGGSQLLQILDATSFSWFVVHGHKHRPKLFNASGGGNPPIVLSAASFSANVRRDALNHSPNQMHLVTLCPERAAELDLDSAGSVLSWNWLPAGGWSPAVGPKGLPAVAGFGARLALSATAKKIAALAGAEKDGAPIRWKQMIAAIPHLEFMLPQDLLLLAEKLKNEHAMVVAMSVDGLIDQVGAST